VRLPEATRDRLHAAAEERLVSVSKLVETFVERGLDRLPPVDGEDR